MNYFFCNVLITPDLSICCFCRHGEHFGQTLFTINICHQCCFLPLRLHYVPNLQHASTSSILSSIMETIPRWRPFSAPLGPGSHPPTSAAFVELSSSSPPDRHFKPSKELSITGQRAQVIDLTTSPPRASSGRGRALRACISNMPVVIDLTSPSSSRPKAPRQDHLISASPQRIIQQQFVDQHYDLKPNSKFYTPPGDPDYNPLSLLGEYSNKTSPAQNPCPLSPR